MALTHRLSAGIAAALILCGCVQMPAAISDVSADRVKVVKRLTTTDAAVAAEAERACLMYDRIVVGPMSYRVLSDGYSKEVLFICKPASADCQKIGGNIICPGG